MIDGKSVESNAWSQDETWYKESWEKRVFLLLMIERVVRGKSLSIMKEWWVFRSWRSDESFDHDGVISLSIMTQENDAKSLSACHDRKTRKSLFRYTVYRNDRKSLERKDSCDLETKDMIERVAFTRIYPLARRQIDGERLSRSFSFDLEREILRQQSWSKESFLSRPSIESKESFLSRLFRSRLSVVCCILESWSKESFQNDRKSLSPSICRRARE